MTVETLNREFSYKPGAARAPESIRFAFLDPADLIVTHVAADTNAPTTLVRGQDYIIAGDSREANATITATATWPADDIFHVVRVTGLKQPAKVPAGQPLPSTDIERELDRMALAAQERAADHQETNARALLAAPGESGLTFAPAVQSRKPYRFVGRDPATGKLIERDLPPSFKGDPGGNVEATGLFNAIPQQHFDAGTNRIATEGHTVRGVGRASYIRWSALLAIGPLSAAHEGYSWIADADGDKWYLDEVVPCLDQIGCIGDGNTDDSIAFNLAVDGTYRAVVARPDAIYLIGDIAPASGVHLFSWSGRGYTTVENQVRPELRMKMGGACLFNVSGKRSITFEGLELNGVDRTAPVISGGSTRTTLRACGLKNGLYGVGGSVDGGGSYSSTLRVIDTVIASNVTGLDNMIDSWINCCEIANNGTNIHGDAGSNSNTISSTRIEWATSGNNIRLTSCAAWLVLGCLIDRGYAASINLKSCDSIKINSNIIRRPNRSRSSAFEDNCHVFLQGCTNIALGGNTFSFGHDDAGGPVTTDTPDYVLCFNGSDNASITVSGGSMTNGAKVAAVRYYSGDIPANLKITGVAGLADFSNSDVGQQVDEGGAFRFASLVKGIAGGGSATLAFKSRSALSTYTLLPLRMRVTVLKPSTGAKIEDNFSLILGRLGSGASIQMSTGFGSIGTAGYVAASGGTINIAFQNVATDGSTASLVVTNADPSNSHDVYIRIE